MSYPCQIRMETSLGKVVRDFVVAKARRERARASGMELRFLFSRLGFGFTDLEELSRAAHGRDMGEALHRRLEARLVAERARLRRLALSGHAAYDVNRHLAVRSAMRWLEGSATDTAPDEARLPGIALNTRFRRRRPRRATA